MSQVTCEKLLRRSFTRLELEFLEKNEEFRQRLEQVRSLDQFEKFCVFCDHLLVDKESPPIDSPVGPD